MNNNSSIDYFINTYIENEKIETLGYQTLEEEIENMFNNILNETCYIYYDTPAISYTLVGIGETIDISNFTCLIPNLFRVCYAQVNAKIPYICPTYTNPVNTVNYIPVLINTNLIKAFLYFNFPGSIKNFNNNYNFINSIYKYRNYKNTNMTNSSFTPSPTILSNIYSKDSLLLELLNFNQYIIKSNNANTNNLIINNSSINWDFTKSCVTYTTSENNIYIISNFTKESDTVTQNNGNNLYVIRNSPLYLYKSNSVSTNGIVMIQKNSIYTILEIASQVQEDIIEEIKFYFQKKIYCKKPYMYTFNIPILLKIYKNYYNNQLYTISKNLSSSNPYTITPKVISIITYVNEFLSIYDSTYPSRYLIKTLYLESGVDALIFYNSLGPNWGSVSAGTIINYWYYYINIGAPSPVELYNISTEGNYNTLTTFTSEYNSTYTSPTSTYNYTISKQIQYNDYGLYSCAGDISKGDNIDAIVFYFVNSSNVLQLILFETLQSPETNYDGINGSDYGIPVPGLVLQYYQNI
jgi:hypothetical protein